MVEFKHENGLTAKSKVSGFQGVITSRSESLYGCNRYYVQPPIDKEGKMPDGWWIDEDELEIIEAEKVIGNAATTGGPVSRTR